MQLIESNLDLLDVRASRGISKDFTSALDTSRTTDKDVLDIFLDMARSDPIISSCMDITVEMTTHAGYCFYPKPTKEGPESDKQSDEAIVYFEDVLNYDMVQDNIVSTLFLFGDAAVELRKEKRVKVDELHVLESTELSIKHNEHGEIEGFIQNPDTARQVEFSKDQVMFIQSRRIGSRVKSYYPLESIAINYTSMLYGNNLLLKIFKNLPPKLMYVLKNADRSTRQQFISNLRLAKSDPAIDLVINGDAEIKSNMFDFESGLISVLRYLRQQILMITRVPPIWLGIVDADGANRGNSEAQIMAFENRVRKIQQRIASAINRDLLPNLGFNKIWFKYNPPSLKSEKQILENSEKLRNLGGTNKAVSRYLYQHGIWVAAKQLSNEQKKDKDIMPSRQREDKTNDDMNSNLDQKGTSDLSSQKMEARSQYWTYEVAEDDK